MRRFALVALFASREFQRLHHPAAPFLRSIAVSFVGHKEFQGSQNERPEAALFRVCTIKVSPFQHAHKETLRQILRLIGRITAPPQKGIQRVPVVLTQGSQCGPSLLRTWIAGSQHQSPARGWKLGRSWQRVYGLVVHFAKQDKEDPAKSYIPLKQFGGFRFGFLHHW